MSALNPRALFAAGVVIVAALLAVLLVPRIGGGDDDATRGAPRVARAELALEQYTPTGTGVRELLVSLRAPALNRLEVNGGDSVAVLRCVDGAGAVAISQPTDWPLVEEPGYLPHVHQLAPPRVIERVRACRLTGPGIDFAGRVSGPPPRAE